MSVLIVILTLHYNSNSMNVREIILTLCLLFPSSKCNLVLILFLLLEVYNRSYRAISSLTTVSPVDGGNVINRCLQGNCWLIYDSNAKSIVPNLECLLKLVLTVIFLDRQFQSLGPIKRMSDR